MCEYDYSHGRDAEFIRYRDTLFTALAKLLFDEKHKTKRTPYGVLLLEFDAINGPVFEWFCPLTDVES